MSNFKVEQIQESVMNFLGKNIFHCKDTNVLYWSDVLGGQVFKMDLNNNNKINMFKILGERIVSFCIPIQGKKDQFIVGAGRRVLLVNWDGVHTMGQIVKVLAEVNVNGVRINQYRVDKQGRLFFGTMLNEEQGDVLDLQKRVGGLYRFTVQDGLTQLKDNVGMGNGIVFNKDFTKMFFVDSFDLNVYEFDYDFKTGNIHNQKILLDISQYGQAKKVFGSGMTIDQHDNLYLCMFGGGKIIKINTINRKVEQEIKMNVQQLTGCEFGGKNLDTMFVTTCSIDTLGHQTYPAGFLMKVNGLGHKGVEMIKFHMN